jgi:hypothetical protein
VGRSNKSHGGGQGHLVLPFVAEAAEWHKKIMVSNVTIHQRSAVGIGLGSQ